MDERSDMEKGDEVLLPGFRFHPTDEELVGFYLKRKIHQKPISIELIRQLDIYKHDPWDLPKLATTGEKEWYFYCPRDRKYRNSARPNRVTGAGFWKATGTDRPIYSSEGTKCIGLKKSLVFYKGRAAKGTKTDWMMHEFRLPSLTDSSLPRRPLDKNIPANDSWAICRIFKKTNSMVQRALSHSWITTLPETTGSDLFPVPQTLNATQFEPEDISCTTGSSIQFACNSGFQHQSNAIAYPTMDVTSTYNKPFSPINFRSHQIPVSGADIPANFMFSPVEIPVASMLPNLLPSVLGDVEKTSASIDFGQPLQCNGLTVDLPLRINRHLGSEEEDEKKSSNSIIDNNNHWGNLRTVGFPFNMPSNLSEEWNPNFEWDSPHARARYQRASLQTNAIFDLDVA